MKYIKYITWMFLIMFIGNVVVNAYDDKNYASATCTYASGSSTYTLEVRSVGTDDLTVISATKTPKPKVGSEKVINKIDDKSFTSSNKIKCPSSISVQSNTTATLTTYYVYAKGNIKLKNEKNNGKPIKLNYKGKECKYAAEIVEGSGSPPTVTIKTDGKSKIEYFFSPNSWSIDYKITTIDASYFKKYISKDDCPTVYVSCYSSSKYNMCSATKDKYINRDGTEHKLDKMYEPPREKPDSDKNSSGNDNDSSKRTHFDPVKPGIKVNVDVSKNGCGIIGEDLQKWLQWALDVIRIGGLVLSVVLGISDYLKAAFSSNEDGMSKANKNFSTRLFCLGLLFLVPTIVEFLLTLLNIGTTSDNPSCDLK